MKILLAVDGTDCSKKALDNVADRGWQKDDQFLILSVIEPYPTDCDPECASDKEQYNHHMQNACEELTSKCVEKLKVSHPDICVEKRVLEGQTVEQIIQCATDWSADLIVVGSMGYMDCRRFMHGSVAQAVLKQSPCSVEVIKEKKN